MIVTHAPKHARDLCTFCPVITPPRAPRSVTSVLTPFNYLKLHGLIEAWIFSQKYVKHCPEVHQIAWIFSEFIQETMNISKLHPLFATNFICNQICFARKLDWTRDVTLSIATEGVPLPGPRWIQSATDMTFSWVKSISNFLHMYCGFQQLWMWTPL